MDKKYTFEEFMDIIRYLRSDKGCPWDRKQTHESLERYMLEEAYESVEAIRNGDLDNLCEELGDVLLQIALHASIAEEKGEFGIEDIITAESEKMIRRHPHVFANQEDIDAGQVVKNWDEIKKEEKNQKSTSDILLNIPKALPALVRAEKAIKKAGKTEEENSPSEVLKSLTESLIQLKKEVENGEREHLEDNFENLLFHIVNLSVILHLNAENSLTNATNKFINRFVDIEGLTQKKPQV